MHKHKHSHSHGHRSKKVLYIKAALIALLGIAVLIGVYSLLNYLEFRPKDEVSTENDAEDYTSINYVRYEEKWYKQNPDIETTLVIGVDKDKFTEDSKQSDFLMLLAVDYKNGTYKSLHINRDTMVDVPQLDLMDNVYDTKNQQIALAYAHGTNERVNCSNTVSAAENLLYGIKIDHYISVSMDAVAIVNDAVGGVPVYVEDDFSAIDPSIKQGETVTLQGDQALTFVRSRQGMDDPTNLSRMERQRVYVESLRQQFNKQSEDTVLDVLVDISDYFVSDCTAPQLSTLVGFVAANENSNIETISGSAITSGEYVEFHVDEDSLTKQIMNLFFVVDDSKEN